MCGKTRDCGESGFWMAKRPNGPAGGGRASGQAVHEQCNEHSVFRDAKNRSMLVLEQRENCRVCSATVRSALSTLPSLSWKSLFCACEILQQ